MESMNEVMNEAVPTTVQFEAQRAVAEAYRGFMHITKEDVLSRGYDH